MKNYLLLLLFSLNVLSVNSQNCGSIAINTNYDFEQNYFTKLTFGIKVDVAQAAPLLSLKAFLKNDTNSAQMALYTDLNNKPNSLITKTNILSNTLTDQIVNFTPAQNIIIQPGSYWVMLEFTTNSSLNYFRFSYPYNYYIEYYNYGYSFFTPTINQETPPHFQSTQIYVPLGLTLDCTASSTNFKDNTFVVFPNPAREDLFVKGLENSIGYNIYNVQGGLVQKGEASNHKAIPIGKLSTGIYFIKLDDQIIKFLKH